MCGPIRILAANAPGAWWKYQIGRALAYAALGLAAGKLGETLSMAGWVLMLGAVAILFISKISFFTQARSLVFQRFQNNSFAWGLGSGLLPCGLLHLWLLAAAASQDPLQGMALLGMLWLGSLPALEGSALFLKTPLFKMRQRFPRAMPMAFLALAILPLFWRMPAFSADPTTPAKPTHSCHQK